MISKKEKLYFSPPDICVGIFNTNKVTCFHGNKKDFHFSVLGLQYIIAILCRIFCVSKFKGIWLDFFYYSIHEIYWQYSLESFEYHMCRNKFCRKWENFKNLCLKIDEFCSRLCARKYWFEYKCLFCMLQLGINSIKIASIVHIWYLFTTANNLLILWSYSWWCGMWCLVAFKV